MEDLLAHLVPSALYLPAYLLSLLSLPLSIPFALSLSLSPSFSFRYCPLCKQDVKGSKSTRFSS